MRREVSQTDRKKSAIAIVKRYSFAVRRAVYLTGLYEVAGMYIFLFIYIYIYTFTYRHRALLHACIGMTIYIYIYMRTDVPQCYICIIIRRRIVL